MPSLVIEPFIVEEPVTNDSINFEKWTEKTNERIEGLSNGIR